MALTINDLQPKDFSIDIEGLKLQCKPPSVSHIMVLSKIGQIFEDSSKFSRTEIVSAEADFNWVIGELIPELRGKKLDFKYITAIITQIMENIAPEETKELNEMGVKIDTDPKAEGRG